MALILGNDLLEDSGVANTLERYPAWVNRLARAGTTFVLDEDRVCNVVPEARVAAGLKGKVGWTLSDSSKNAKKKGGATGDVSRSQKKELTDKQKAALAKLKKVSK